MRFCFLLLIVAIGCNSVTSPHDANSLGSVRRLDGSVKELTSHDLESSIFLFVKTDCPIGNRYAPKINELARLAGDSNLRFFLVYPDDHLAQTDIEAHQQAFDLALPTYCDPEHELVRLTGTTRAPEAVVYDSTGAQVYRGRIDDRYVDFGKARPAPTSHDLQDVIESLAAGERLTPRTTEAVGCYLE